MKQKHAFDNVVAETLLIPLYMRAKESRRGESAILKDEMAEELVDSIEYDYSKLDEARLSEVGCVIRGWYFDKAVRRFIAEHDRPIVVNVGCGLDTRAQRIGDDGCTVFYELDLPEVIVLRRKLIPEPMNDHYLAASLLETGWMDELKKRHPEGDFIFVVEGVLMYFYEEQVRFFLREVAARFPGGELWFDVCGKTMYRRGLKPDSLRGHKAEIRSGISDGHLPTRWVPSLTLIEQANYMKFFRPRWGILFGQVLGRMKKVCYRFSSMLVYRIESSASD